VGPAARSETATPVPLQPVRDDNFDFNGAFGLGAAWVFGATVTGPSSCQPGNSVTLSADGNTAIVSGPGNNSDAGAVWGAGEFWKNPGRDAKEFIPARLQVPQPVGGRSASRNALLSTLVRLVPRIGCKDCAYPG
jgi:hypothetical protein